MKWFRSPVRWVAALFGGDLRMCLDDAARARKARDWDAAIAIYRDLLTRRPAHAGVHLQLGHALREAGRLDDAAAAYQAALAIRPDFAQAYLHLGHVAKHTGRKSDAIEAYASALELEPGSTAITNALIEVGARHRLPNPAYGRSAATDALGLSHRRVEEAVQYLDRSLWLGAYSLDQYAAFRAAYPVPRAPTSSSLDICLLIDAQGVPAHRLRSTLTSLLDQTHLRWRAVVRATPDQTAHSVASFGFSDPRITFAVTDQEVRASLDEGAWKDAPLALASAGAAFDPEALGWLAFAMDRHPNVAAVVCDHDRHLDDWRTEKRLDPVLYGVWDRYELAQAPTPAVVLLARGCRGIILADTGAIAPLDRRFVLSQAADHGAIAGLSRILVSQPTSASDQDGVQADEMARGPVRVIRLVVPTRDHPQMLASLVDSVDRLSDRPDRIRFTIVDNRSIDPVTHRLFVRLARRGDVDILPADEPFNWSRLNNLAAHPAAPDDILVFCNNDIELVSQGWDSRLRDLLDRAEVGVVGARLLYPSGAIQHVGVAFGGIDGRPVHEGVGEAADARGPLDRWQRRHTVAAVTGAFLAVRGSVFNDVGGFTERLSIAYNDLDFCLKVRERGLQIVFEPEVTATHHESLTRGLNNSAEKVAWDDEELRDLRRRWGDALQRDPGINPHWSSAPGRAFEGFREPPLSRVLAHLDATASGEPWRVQSAGPAPLED
jgi:O-antigen biosynthesis protein